MQKIASGVPDTMKAESSHSATLWLIAVTLLFPLFLQFSGGVFNSVALVIDSGGLISQLPLPISIITCIAGILAFAGNYRQAAIASVFSGALLLAMVLSVIFAGAGAPVEWRKLLLAAQFLLPVIGLFLGQLVRDEQDVIPRGFLWVLLVLVPVQLVAGWWQHTLTLTHYLYIFSIYQHFQFVPVIFVMAYCLVMVHLWDTQAALLKGLTLVMGIYVIASAAFLAICAYSGFVTGFFLLKLFRLKTGRRTGLLAFGMGMVAAVLVVCVYFAVAKNSTAVVDNNGQYANKFQRMADGHLPLNVVGRLSDWKMYGNWIVESNRTLAFGHPSPPPREVKTSAHNWYLDFVYNFGLIAMLPVIALVGYTAWAVVRRRRYLAPATLWLAGLVAFMVLVDNTFKVTLRQPYPGIFSYVLWGLLLTRLQTARPFAAQVAVKPS